ncbi:hypothetical protein NQ317_017837 [Molorchus minor]|uniref:Uncharacterized protein n=1 Tax=Molorchus minor TaxID=1323400 RepID=A0ABQ9IUQ8_9CUCU|nr:hypothetical protein NQ317_017837 [Molorchus minor]
MSFRLEQNSILFNKHIMTAVYGKSKLLKVKKVKKRFVRGVRSNDYLLIKALFIIITRGVCRSQRGLFHESYNLLIHHTWVFSSDDKSVYATTMRTKNSNIQAENLRSTLRPPGLIGGSKPKVATPAVVSKSNSTSEKIQRYSHGKSVRD